MNEKLTVYGENLCCEGGANRVLTIKLDTLSQKLDAAKVGTQHVLIVTQGADGAFTINALVSAPAAVNAALAAYYTANKKELKGKAVEQQQTDANANLNNYIEEAAAAAVQ